MPRHEVSSVGLAISFAVTVLATVIGMAAQATASYHLNTPSLVLFGCALLILSGAAVNFEPSRILK